MSVRVGSTLISPLVNSGSSGGGILTITYTITNFNAIVEGEYS